MAGKGKKDWFSKAIDKLEGDKVIWMIVFMLIVISIVAISSSTSLLAKQFASSRMSYAMEQVFVSLFSLGLILFIYKFFNVGVLRLLSKYGFVVSFAILLFLVSHFRGIPFFRPVQINGAWRAIEFFGFQIHVFEVVKVLMVMYLAWAMNTLKENDTPLADKLVKRTKWKWFTSEVGKLTVYVFAPMALICLLEITGSNSSAIFLALVMTAVIIIGGVKWRYIVVLVACGLFGLGVIFSMDRFTNIEIFHRVATGISRIVSFGEDPLEELHKYKPGTLEFQSVLDDTMQPVAAKVAVSEGGLFGKGPGQSTQRYKVAVIYEDYMFSFIVEEYGILGALVILILYGSLFARGAIIVTNCSRHFAKVLVAGLVILISGQALLHILVNVDIIPLTGQTLPMISHGTSSFLAFSVAFGILLVISKEAKKNVTKASEEINATPIIVRTGEGGEADEQ